MTAIESQRLHPRLQQSPTSTPLSILDATVARFAPTGAIWIFDEKPTNLHEEIFLSSLRVSFIETLSKFPQWAGQIQWAPVKSNGCHTERFNRPILVYGTDTDPGVDWKVVRHPCRIHEIVPTAKDRASKVTGNRPGAWNGNVFNQGLFLPSAPLALHNLKECIGLPGMQVQISLLQDGGYAIGVKIAHCLADAQALMVFVHLWAANNQKQIGLNPQGSTMADPIFNPALLDNSAAGDIDAPEPDSTLTKVARELPLHRYSWWDTSDKAYPTVCIPTTENSKPPSADLALAIQQNKITPSTPAPWSSWDFAKPISYTLLHFTAAQLRTIQAQAQALNTQESRKDISRLDALLAHLWKSITKARKDTAPESPDPIYLNLSLGVRTRTQPPLPQTFIGSPLFLTHVSMPGTQNSQAPLSEIAARIRDTMKKFTPEAVGAILHDAAHEISPQRLWQGFLGRGHVLATSWLRLGLYDVSFGGGGVPRYVHAVMPKVDGCLQVMDDAVEGGGMDVALYLDDGDMRTLLGDSLL
ncbi:uncharacterized protein N7511_010411 [Penicillium nucicola]|uniref:uncharacterized protein n=1 Tax=Penicillium nucicola TaxID=1850975 RepID=UPI00254545F9|nr:uncharacterized protein N7511_010411 [Penicillium nucicola]KAJ5748715.1 hypothetical protein N7511_010411 [Penicillium nucicola]